jgi:protein-disulfide isomerase
MAKRLTKRSRTQTHERKTNWWLIGGFVGVGVIGLFALLFLSLQSAGAPPIEPAPEHNLILENYCKANPDNCLASGSADAPITIVEISDYGCGHCRNFNLDTADALKAQYVDSGQVRWVTLPYALGGQTGFPTAPSATAVLCANEQGAFEDFHTALFTLQGTNDFNTINGFTAIGSDLGLDTDALAACVEDGRYNDILNDNIQIASQAGINSTPSFFINGQLVRGNMPLENFQQIIETELGS